MARILAQRRAALNCRATRGEWLSHCLWDMAGIRRGAWPHAPNKPRVQPESE